MAAPSGERWAHLDVLAWEAFLASAQAARNGHALAADVAWLVSYRALAAPGTAARCPHVLAALPTDVLAAVLRLAGAVTPLARATSQEAASEVPAGRPWVTIPEAARALGVGRHGARAACRRGALTAARGPNGEWRIDREALDEYRRTHGKDY